jgi:cytoskeletal protein CcmA (bactofilin family)
MWKKEETKPQSLPQTTVNTVAPAPVSAPSVAPTSASAPAATLPVSSHAAACISQGIRIKGEVIGKEDLFVDGTLEGKLDLGNGCVTVGPNGKVKADISARDVVVRGNVEGKIDGTERVQLWTSGRVTGEVRTERLAIEDGAVLRGKVEAGKSHAKSAEDRLKSAGSHSNEKATINRPAVNPQTAVI